MLRSRTLHKWIGVAIGLVLLMWTITGIIMVWPTNRVRDTSGQTVDLSRAIVSPAQALERLADQDSAAPARAVSLVQILDHVVYQVDTRRRTFLVDAENGELFEITPAVAESIARKSFRGTVGEVMVEQLTAYDARYGSGDLPAWRVSLGDEAGTVSYVSGKNGTVISGDSRRRFRSVAGKLHDFSAIKVIVSADWVHRFLAIGACLLAITSIVTGYWLALPRKPPQRERATLPMSRVNI